jgi:O-antigen/teichoic acid export membrane protein
VFFLVPLYTSVLSTSDYGIYDIAITTVTLVSPILTVNIADACMRFLMQKETDEREILAISWKFVSLGIAAFGLIILLISYTRISSVIYNYSLLIFVYFSFYVLYLYGMQAAKGLELVKEMTLAGVFSTLAVIAFNVLFLLIIPKGLSGFFLANILGQALPAIYLIIRTDIYKKMTLKVNKGLQKEMLRYCAPLITVGLSWWVNSVSDRYAVSWMCGLSTNGIYSIAYKIPSILVTVQNIFTQAWQISAIKEYGSKDSSQFYRSMFLYLNILMCVVCSVLIMSSKIIARTLFAKDFYGAWQYVPFLLVSCIFNASAGFIGPILAAEKNSKAMAKSAVVGAIVNIILNIMLIYLMGAQGAAIATAISSFTIFLCRLVAVKSIISSTKFIGVYLAWSVVCVQAAMIVYSGLFWIQPVSLALIILVFFCITKGKHICISIRNKMNDFTTQRSHWEN